MRDAQRDQHRRHGIGQGAHGRRLRHRRHGAPGCAVRRRGEQTVEHMGGLARSRRDHLGIEQGMPLLPPERNQRVMFYMVWTVFG